MTGSYDPKVEKISRFAVDFIRLCGEEALNFFGKGKESLKFDETLVTEAELYLSDLFKDRLELYFPEHRIYRGDQDYSSYTHDESRYLWIFDPLDGVANFQAGIPLWGISLALFDNNWPVFGVFYMPSSGSLFQAQVGREAYLNKKPILVSSQDTISDESLLFIYSRFHRHYQTGFPGKIRNLGCTGAHLCYVGMGCAEAAVIANESFQNLAAASIIVEAAGGSIYKMDGSQFILGDYFDGKKENEHLIAASPDIHVQISDFLHPVPE